jgi:hypothetical protein
MTATHINKTKFTSSENHRLAPRRDFAPLRSSQLNENKNKAVVFCPDTKNKS